MAAHRLHLFLLMLACFYLVSSNADYAVPVSRLNNLPNIRREIVVTRRMQQEQYVLNDKMEDDFIKGRMDFERNDYGPPSADPIHTPPPPT